MPWKIEILGLNLLSQFARKLRRRRHWAQTCGAQMNYKLSLIPFQAPHPASSILCRACPAAAVLLAHCTRGGRQLLLRFHMQLFAVAPRQLLPGPAHPVLGRRPGMCSLRLLTQAVEVAGSWRRRWMRSRRMGFRDQEEESCACEFS